MRSHGQERSLMEYRQAELRPEQLYTQIRMQVVNAIFALANDRAQVRSAQAAGDYARRTWMPKTKLVGRFDDRECDAAAAQPCCG